MQVCISHRTALSYLLRVPNVARGAGRVSRARAVPKACPSSQEVRRLRDALEPYLPEEAGKLDIVVSDRGRLHQTEDARVHLCTAELPSGSFVPDVAMGIGFHVSSPELVFLQMAEEVELDQLIYVGFALCSSFRLDDLEQGGCIQREGRDEPLTSVARIRYCESTTRRSSSFARGSVLPEKSTAAPEFQKFFHILAEAAKVFLNDGSFFESALSGEYSQTNSSVPLCGSR